MEKGHPLAKTLVGDVQILIMESENDDHETSDRKKKSYTLTASFPSNFSQLTHIHGIPLH